MICWYLRQIYLRFRYGKKGRCTDMEVIGYKLVDDDDKKVSKKLISAFVQGAISDDNEREKVLKYIEEISE